MGGAYKKKGVNVRFGFDVLRISQVRTTSQKQSNCDVPGMIISPSKRFVIVKRYILFGVGLFKLLVSISRAMREPLEREASDRLAPRFLFKLIFKV